MIRLLAFLFTLTAGALCATVLEERIEHAGSRFRVVRTTPEKISLVWKDAQGNPYATFDKVQSHFDQNVTTVEFLMNAGIFEAGGIPSGLHVENRRTFRPLNLANAPGNFYLKPNGVFRIEETTAGLKAFVCISEEFPKTARTLLAVQSGPVLLTAGRRHPAFMENSPNKLLRNGVGVDRKGQVVFAITDRGQSVNFWDFAGLFLKLDCKDALFLDGGISQMAVNPDKPFNSNQFGAIFVITTPK